MKIDFVKTDLFEKCLIKSRKNFGFTYRIILLKEYIVENELAKNKF